MDKVLSIMPPHNIKEAKMIKPDLWLQIKFLYQEGHAKREIARLLGVDRKTVRKAIKQDKTPSYLKAGLKHPAKLDPFKDYIKIRLNDGVTNAVKLLREITQRGYTGKISILRDFMRPLREEQHRQAWLRFETLPGEQAQADWAHFCGFDPFGYSHRFYCFAMLLGFSRCLYAEFTDNMDLITLLRCHQHAFEYFSGVTKTILYDNMKQVVLDRDLMTDTIYFNPKFLDFAHHYSFQPRACWPRSPQTKGKTESSIGYVKKNFWQGERYTDLFTMNSDLREWLDNVCNCRIHGTTREIPADRLKLENLIPMPRVPYDTSLITSRIATKDCFISYQGDRYSVPFQYVRRALTVRDRGDGHILIYAQDELIATHRLCLDKGRMVINPAHFRELLAKKRGCRDSFREHLQAPVTIGSVLKEVIETLVEKRDLNVYQKILAEER